MLAVGLDGGGAVAAAALRTAPWPMLCTPVDPDDADALLDLWLDRDPDMPGINAVLDTARSIASAWARAHRRHCTAVAPRWRCTRSPPSSTRRGPDRGGW